MKIICVQLEMKIICVQQRFGCIFF